MCEPDLTGIFLNDSLCLLQQIASFLKIALLVVALVVVGYSLISPYKLFSYSSNILYGSTTEIRGLQIQRAFCHDTVRCSNVRSFLPILLPHWKIFQVYAQKWLFYLRKFSVDEAYYLLIRNWKHFRSVCIEMSVSDVTCLC